MSNILGIDLGTTNSAMSTLEGGEPKIIANAEGLRTTPSVVAFAKGGSDVLVGEPAKRQAVTNVERTISSVKRHMGSDWTVNVDGKKYTPQEISSRILQKLKRDAEAYLGGKVSDVVITVPAYFNDAQRQATKEAGEIAGFNVLRIINEPTAAALAYGLEKGNDDELILVFDLGGGTFDVSVLEIAKDEDGFSTIQVKATAGDNLLGGDDWDKALSDYLVDSFKKNTGVDLKGDKIALQRIKDASEQAKKELSTASSTTVSLPYLSLTADGPVNMEESISRAQFEKLTNGLLERTRKPFNQVIKDSGVKVGDISHVVMVGGSTRMPAVVELVKELTGGKQPNQSVNPDEVVAVGAVLQAGVIKGHRKDVLLIDVTPLTLGIETAGGIMTKMIERNSAIPTKKTEIFSTAVDNQSAVTIQVFQGEREFTKDNKSLGQFNLEGIAPAPRGVPQVEVMFDIDANGIVHVSAKDKATGKEQKIAITGGSNLSKEDVDRMVREAEANAGEDKARRADVEELNAGEQLVYTVEKQLKEHGDKVDASLKSMLEAQSSELKEAVEAKDVDKVRRVRSELEANLSRIGESVYAGSESSAQSSEEDVVDAEIVE